MTQPPTYTTDSRQWTLIEKLLTVLAAILTLVAAFFGYQTQRAQAVAANKGTDLSSLQDQFNQLKIQNDKLASENTQLRSKLGLPGPTAAPQSPAGASVRHTGLITLSASGEAADLDSPQSDLQWRGRRNSFSDLGNLGYADLGYDGANLLFGSESFVLYLKTTKADYETCRGRTGYGHYGLIDKNTIQLGDYLCLKTGDHRYAAIRLTQLGPSMATFDVTTYDPPES